MRTLLGCSLIFIAFLAMSAIIEWVGNNLSWLLGPLSLWALIITLIIAMFKKGN